MRVVQCFICCLWIFSYNFYCNDSNNTTSSIKNFANGILDKFSNMISDDGSVSDGTSFISNSSNANISSNQSLIQQGITALGNTVSSIANITTNISNVASQVSSLTNVGSVSSVKNSISSSNKMFNVVNAISGQESNLKTTVSSIVESLKTSIASTVSKLNDSKIIESSDVSVIKSSLEENLNAIKSNIGEKLVGKINSINSANSPLLEKLKSGLNTCVVSLTSNSINEATEAIKNITAEFVELSNKIIDNGVGAVAGSVAEMVLSNEDLKKQAEELLSEKLLLMKNLGVSEEQIAKVQEIYDSTLKGTLEKVVLGDYAGATADLTARKEELKEYLGENVESFSNSIEDKKQELTATLLEKTGLSDTEVGNAVEEVTKTINVGSIAEKVLSGDIESVKEEVTNTVHQVQEVAAANAESLINSAGENLANKILEKTGLKENSIASSLLSGAINSLNLGGLASSLISGGIKGLKTTASDTINNIKSNLTQENIQNKVTEVVSNVMEQNDTMSNIQGQIRKWGESLKASFNNSSIGITAIGTALTAIVDSAVTNGNEGAITAVNQILQGDVNGGLTALKNSGLSLVDSSISTSIKVAESLITSGIENISEKINSTIEKAGDKVSEYENIIEADGKNETDNNKKRMQDYIDYLNTDEGDVEIAEKEKISEEELAERESYKLHESIIAEEEMSHKEAAIHNKKTTSNTVGNSTN